VRHDRVGAIYRIEEDVRDRSGVQEDKSETTAGACGTAEDSLDIGGEGRIGMMAAM